MLASMIIDEVGSVPGSKVLYFYCKHGDLQRQTFVAMARSFLSQLMQMDDFVVSILCGFAATDSDSTITTRKAAEHLLNVCLDDIGPVTIVLDGVDECPEFEQKAIVQWIRQFAQNRDSHENVRRCVFLSQYDESTKVLLSRMPDVRIQAEDNHADIEAYCLDWIDRLQNKFATSGLEKSEARRIALVTSRRADGMSRQACFRCDIRS